MNIKNKGDKMKKLPNGWNQEQWDLFYDIFRRNSELIFEGIKKRKERYKVLSKEFGHSKYFVREEDQPKLDNRAFAIKKEIR